MWIYLYYFYIIGLNVKYQRVSSSSGWEDVINKDLKEMGTSWEGLKRKALNRLDWRSVRSCVGVRWLGAAVSY